MIRKEVMLKDNPMIVDLNCPVARFPDNPVLTADDVNQIWQDPGLQVTTVHNAGIALHDGDTVMLFRSHLRCGMSVLGIARSSNGVDGWRVEPRPAMVPAPRGMLSPPAPIPRPSSRTSRAASRTRGSPKSATPTTSPTVRITQR